MEIKYHGHSCFELSDGETTVLVDPFLKPNNPAAVRTLLAEEARMGMMVGVAVGWALAEELRRDEQPEQED